MREQYDQRATQARAMAAVVESRAEAQSNGNAAGQRRRGTGVCRSLPLFGNLERNLHPVVFFFPKVRHQQGAAE